MESDADRLDSIRALGGILVRVDDREVWALFDDVSTDALNTPGVEVRIPTLTCRSSDVSDVQKDVPVSIGTELYRVRKAEPDAPALGWTTLRLKR